MSRSIRAWTKAILTVFATVALAGGLYAAPARARSASGQHTAPSTTDPKPRSTNIDHTDAPVLGPWTGYSSRDGAASVRALQRRLANAGYAPGPIDGLYGPLTEQAVVLFQVEHGLQVDGIAGPRTLAAIGRPPTILYPGAGYSGQGSGSVRSLQRRLARAGYAPGPIDGRYGPRTENAVRRFQARHGLQADGIAGPLTLGRLGTGTARRVGRVTHPAPAHRAGRPLPGPGLPRPHAALHRPSPTTVPTQPRSHRKSSLPLGLIALLLGLAAALVLATMALVSRRRDKRPALANAATTGTTRNGPIQVMNRQPGPATPVGGQATRVPADPTVEPLAPAEPQTRVERTTPVESRTPGEPLIAAEAHPPEDAPTTTATRTPNEGGDPNNTQEPNHRQAREEADRVFRQALALEEARELTGAVAAYRRADELGHATAPSNLGVLLEQHGDAVGAEASYRRADQRGDPDGAFNLGLLLGEQGDYVGALAAYERADRRGHGTAAANLGVLLGERGDLTAAEACFQRADKRGDAHGAFNLAVLLDQQGEHAGALEAYGRAERLGNEAIADRARAAAREVTSKLAAVGKGGDRHAP
jgi:peptidoglycan hydrolase-like protein with peptidoglycan-binding domain